MDKTKTILREPDKCPCGKSLPWHLVKLVGDTNYSHVC